MKTNLNFLALDCEFNQPSGKLIEVGVCVGNLSQGIFYEKNWLINPGERLSPEIVTLTGITDQMISDESVGVEALRAALIEVDKELSPFVNPVVWGVGDERRVKEFVLESGLDFPLWGHRTIDVKTLYVFKQLLKNKSARAGLKSALATHKMTFEGQPHRAKDDAKNTLRLFFNLVQHELKKDQAIQALVDFK